MGTPGPVVAAGCGALRIPGDCYEPARPADVSAGESSARGGGRLAAGDSGREAGRVRVYPAATVRAGATAATLDPFVAGFRDGVFVG